MSKYLLLALILLSGSTAFFAWLSWSLNADKAVLSADLQACAERNSILVNEVDKAYLSCAIDDAASTENTKGQTAVDNKREDVKDQIDKLPSVPKKPTVVTPPPKTDNGVQDESNTVDIDGRLPDSLQRLLNSAYSSGVQG
jgi:hypothetical protein